MDPLTLTSSRETSVPTPSPISELHRMLNLQPLVNPYHRPRINITNAVAVLRYVLAHVDPCCRVLSRHTFGTEPRHLGPEVAQVEL